MSTAVARRRTTTIARPLKVLVPLIREDIGRGERAGMEYYAEAGAKLMEAKDQVAYGYWGTWLGKNFELSAKQASVYMRLARLRENGSGESELPRSLNEMQGKTEWVRRSRKSEQKFRSALQDLDTDLFAQEKQTRDDEVRLHREMAVELVDIGFKALASRLHPDRGGSKEAMARLNRVRDELKGLAQTRRYV